MIKTLTWTVGAVGIALVGWATATVAGRAVEADDVPSLHSEAIRAAAEAPRVQESQRYEWAGRAFAIPPHVKPTQDGGRLVLEADNTKGTRVLMVGSVYIFMGAGSTVVIDAQGRIHATTGTVDFLRHLLRRNVGMGASMDESGGFAATAPLPLSPT